MISLSIRIVPRYFNVRFCQNGIASKKDGPSSVWIYANGRPGGRRVCWSADFK